MLQAGLKEATILRELTKDDPKAQAHTIHLYEDFRLGEHLCLVMEAMHVNLRKLLKTYGANQGLAVKAVLNYTSQLLVGLAFLQQKGIVHADLKPDNLVVNEKFSVLKICDFGSAMRTKEFEDLDDCPYLQSRFYRAPEVMLGYPPRNCQIDMWSAATSMYEMYTGQVLFPGRHNNEVLKNMMEVRGPFARRLLKKASPTLRTQHFDDINFNFLLRELDLAGRNETVRSVPQVTAPTKQLGEMLAPPRLAAKMPADVKVKVEQLKNFLEQALVLDPTKRITPVEGLQLLQGGRR
jgi:serine/threonine-protein kinase PRP4